MRKERICNKGWIGRSFWKKNLKNLPKFICLSRGDQLAYSFSFIIFNGKRIYYWSNIYENLACLSIATIKNIGSFFSLFLWDGQSLYPIHKT
jgi:hypothetical protein